MVIFFAQVVKRLSPRKESRVLTIMISASWAKSPMLASTPSARPSKAALNPPPQQSVKVCKRLVWVRSPQLGKPLLVSTFLHTGLILSRFRIHCVIAVGTQADLIHDRVCAVVQPTVAGGS
jgi:hypothetical protein